MGDTFDENKAGKGAILYLKATFSTVYCHRVLNERLQTMFDMWSGVNISGFLPSTVSK